MHEITGPNNQVGELTVIGDVRELPPILHGHETPEIHKRVEKFYLSIAEMFEAWLKRRKSPHTRRAYRRDVMDFIEFIDIPWPQLADDGKLVGQDDSWRLLQVTVQQVQSWRDYSDEERNLAPLTLNRRLSSLSGFYRYIREAAAHLRLPITVPNPAHSQFIGRESQDPVNPTEAISATRVRQLFALPDGEDVTAYRDRAILKFYIYSGARIRTGCLLHVADFLYDEEDPKMKLQEKGRGKSKRTIGINQIAADAILEYIEVAGLTKGPLFRARRSPRSKELSDRRMATKTMYLVVGGYLARLPGAMKEIENEDGSLETRCIYTTHTLRATAATLLLDSGEDIRDVQKLLGHKHVTVTQGYDKRRKGTKQSASHRLVI